MKKTFIFDLDGTLLNSSKKEIASHTTESNDNNGVALFVSRYLNN